MFQNGIKSSTNVGRWRKEFHSYKQHNKTIRFYTVNSWFASIYDTLWENIEKFIKRDLLFILSVHKHSQTYVPAFELLKNEFWWMERPVIQLVYFLGEYYFRAKLNTGLMLVFDQMTSYNQWGTELDFFIDSSGYPLLQLYPEWKHNLDIFPVHHSGKSDSACLNHFFICSCSVGRENGKLFPFSVVFKSYLSIFKRFLNHISYK